MESGDEDEEGEEEEAEEEDEEDSLEEEEEVQVEEHAPAPGRGRGRGRGRTLARPAASPKRSAAPRLPSAHAAFLRRLPGGARRAAPEQPAPVPAVAGVAAAVAGGAEPAPRTPPRVVPYAPADHFSPNRDRRGRRKPVQRLAKAKRTSPSEILLMPARKLIAFCKKHGFFPETFEEDFACTEDGCHRRAKPVDCADGVVGFRCSCGKRYGLQARMAPEEKVWWLERVPLRHQLAAHWCFTRGYTAAEVSDSLKLGPETVQDLYRRFVDLVSRHQEEANRELCVGGSRLQCEADEVAFRSKAELVDGEPRLVWLRYIALVRRKSRYVLLDNLPDRAVAGNGQGGGGALSNEELFNFLRPDTDKPRLKKRSVLHTDSAKAYRKVGIWQRPGPGPLHGSFEGEPEYVGHELHSQEKAWPASCLRA